MEEKLGGGTWIMQSPSVIAPVVRLLAEHIAELAPGNPPMSAARFMVDGAKLDKGLDALCATLPEHAAARIRIAAEEYLQMQGYTEEEQSLAQERAAKLRELVLTACSGSSADESAPPPSPEWDLD